MALTKIGALWVKEGKKGKFMAGKVDLKDVPDGTAELDLMIFPNKREWVAENPKRPSHEIVTDEDNLVGGSQDGGEDDSIPF